MADSYNSRVRKAISARLIKYSKEANNIENTLTNIFTKLSDPQVQYNMSYVDYMNLIESKRRGEEKLEKINCYIDAFEEAREICLDMTMDDLISRQAAREALLDKGQSSRRYKLGESWELNWFEIEDALSSIPTIEAEPVNYGEWWISCSERTPEMLTETLDGRYSDCCLVFAEETEWIGMAYYRTNNSESWWEFADAQNKPKIDWAEITHWMPLPNCPNCGAKMDGGADDECKKM